MVAGLLVFLIFFFADAGLPIGPTLGVEFDVVLVVVGFIPVGWGSVAAGVACAGFLLPVFAAVAVAVEVVVVDGVFLSPFSVAESLFFLKILILLNIFFKDGGFGCGGGCGRSWLKRGSSGGV